MSTPSADTASASPARGRGRGKSRGGLGKYLRARGRGRGRGRPAEFSQRLLLEGEGRQNLTEEESTELEKELREKYARRSLGTNVDRYKEEEPELDSDGEPIVEPEVDLSRFLEKQTLSDDVGPSIQAPTKDTYDEDDVDTSLAHITSDSSQRATQLASKKGKVQQIVWDKELEDLSREKKTSEATKDLKDRFKAKSERLKSKPLTPTSISTRKNQGELEAAPALPLPSVKPKSDIEEMEEFLDDLIG